MKCICVGDVFITPEMMQEAVKKFAGLIASSEFFFFGRSNRKVMRDVVKIIERGGRDELELPAGLEQAVADAEILMVHLCPVTKTLLDKAPKLKFILCNRGGYENVDVEAAAAAGVKVLNNPAHNANAVAELTIGLILSEVRNIARSHLSLKSGEWREKYPNTGRVRELKDQIVGIVGFGNVGRLVCERLCPFGCKFLIHTPHHREVDDTLRIDWSRVKFASLEEVITKSDIVTLHARAPKGIVLFGRRTFEMMKPTAYFINTARSYMVDYNALYDALAEGQIAGAAIDVYEMEPLGPAYPFLRLDNVTLTNHRGSDTLNAYSDSPPMMLKMLEDYVRRGIQPKFLVNG